MTSPPADASGREQLRMAHQETARRTTGRPGALVRVFIPSLEALPPLSAALCGFSGCGRRARQLEWVGRCEATYTCAGHRLWTDPER